MLIINRKKGERIYIGDDTELVILEVKGDRVKLGFEAPRELKIDRAEVRHGQVPPPKKH